MAKKKLSNREILDQAKKKPLHAKAVKVPVDEISEGMVVTCYPLRTDGLRAIFAGIDGDSVVSDGSYWDWRLIIECYWDDDNNHMFTEDDIPFLEKFGYGLKNKLYMPAMAMSGLSLEANLEKKND